MTILDNLRSSVWKLPHDREIPNKLRECAWYDDYCCQCDNRLNIEYEEKNCHNPEKIVKNLRIYIKKRTIVLIIAFQIGL
jgi:hypothetical protein